MSKELEKWDYFALKLPARTSANPFLDVALEAASTLPMRTGARTFRRL